MKIVIKGSAKEITDLVLQLQSRRLVVKDPLSVLQSLNEKLIESRRHI